MARSSLTDVEKEIDSDSLLREGFRPVENISLAWLPTHLSAGRRDLNENDRTVLPRSSTVVRTSP